MARRGYVQLANGFYLNRKVRRLRRTMPSAVSAFVVMLSYCGDNLTDGFVDSDTAEFVLDITTQELDALQQVGLIEAVDGGYVIHDYLEHNRSRQQVLRSRKKTAERVARHRENDDVTPLHASRNGVTSQKHQNTRTPEHQKKEKEEYSSSFSKEIGLNDFELVREKTHANAAIIRDYPNLDLSDAWNAFLSRHYGENRTIADWTRLWKGWCQRRAKMSGIPPSKRHVHTWKCSHVLEALGRDEETAQADEKACELADRLNKEKS